ncbi:HTH_Tnp_Tc3_2 domain-containing protein [Trichonephila clavipes]|nr:HTH_Tnp_Tc3_2 domain-containing protein [Trichonephila clavipes]
MAVTYRSVTSRNIAQHIESLTHHSVSARTIRCRLQQSDLSSKRPLLGLPLTQNHRRLRRQCSTIDPDYIPAATPDQLWQRVEAAWSTVPQECIQSLFESLPRRVIAVISNNGGYFGN